MITLKVGIAPGTRRTAAIVEARHLARRLNVFVEYDFNDRGAVLVGPNDSEDDKPRFFWSIGPDVPRPPSAAVDQVIQILKSCELTGNEANSIVAIVRGRARSSKLKAPITDEQFSAEVSTSTRVEE